MSRVGIGWGRGARKLRNIAWSTCMLSSVQVCKQSFNALFSVKVTVAQPTVTTFLGVVYHRKEQRQNTIQGNNQEIVDHIPQSTSGVPV